jgi:hypothetical protein
MKQMLRWMDNGIRGMWLGAAPAAAVCPLDHAVAASVGHVMGDYEGSLVRVVGNLGSGLPEPFTGILSAGREWCG